MRAVLLLAIAALLLPAAVTAQTQQSTCHLHKDVGQCYGNTREPAYQACVWNAQLNTCEQDPCTKIAATEPFTCLQAGCLPQRYSTSQTSCVSPSLVCNVLSEGECTASNRLCQWRLNYCAGALDPVFGTGEAQCDIHFPQWSIALVIIWVCIMVILGFIIFLVVQKGKQANVTVEQSNVEVDSINVRNADTFNVGGNTDYRPINA